MRAQSHLQHHAAPNPDMAFLEVGEDKLEGVVDVASLSLEAGPGIWQLILQEAWKLKGLCGGQNPVESAP